MITAHVADLASSGSGTGATIAKDTVTVGTSVTGLAGALAVADAADGADRTDGTP